MTTPDKLVKLHTTLVDAQNGYEEAAHDAGEPQIAEFFRGMVSFHRQNADEILVFAREQRVEIDNSGSFLSTIHRTVVRIRSAVVRLDATELKPFISGEERIVSEYDEALDESATSPQTIILLNRQKTAVLEKIDQMKAMKGVAENR